MSIPNYILIVTYTIVNIGTIAHRDFGLEICGPIDIQYLRFIWKRLMTKKKYSAIEFAMRYLTQYPKSERDMEVILLQKKYTEKEIEVAIYKLKQAGLLDDAHYVKLYIDSEVIKKGKPISAVKTLLFKKGIEKHIVEKYCADNWKDIRDGIFQRIELEIEKYKAKGFVGIEIIQKLQQRGYLFGHIQEAVNRRRD